MRERTVISSLWGECLKCVLTMEAGQRPQYRNYPKPIEISHNNSDLPQNKVSKLLEVSPKCSIQPKVKIIIVKIKVEIS